MKYQLLICVLVLLWVNCICVQTLGAKSTNTHTQETLASKPDSLDIEKTNLGNSNNINRTLFKDSEGNEYVVFNGTVMRKKEFQATGGDRYKQDEYNKEKESKAKPTVHFVKSENQKYGFDAYTKQKTALQNEYPELQSGYRPTFKSVASHKTDKVAVTGATSNTTFRTEWGIPVVAAENSLTIRGNSNGDKTILYAYRKQDTIETVIGKLNILSFDEQTKKVYLVKVNDARLPNIKEVEAELNRIYAPAVTQWEVHEAEGIYIDFSDGQFTHSVSNAISVYNKDQKTVINKFGIMEKDALYLFFIENVKGKDFGGDYAGYMPLYYQSGFIYDFPSATVIAHELAHGAFGLYHTFSRDKYIAAQNTTNNLLDYKGGDELWMFQWQLIHDPKNIWLDFLQNERGRKATTIHNNDTTISDKSIEIDFSEIECELEKTSEH